MATPSPADSSGLVISSKVDVLYEFSDAAVVPAPAERKDPLSLRRIDHVRFFVGNARQSAYFYRNAFGFDVVAYAGLETKTKHEAGYVLRQGNITIVLASPLGPSHPEANRIVLHGDGVQDVALEVDDVRTAYNAAVVRGAVGVIGPTALEDEHGVYEYAAIRAYGDTTHSFVNRDRYHGVFAPGYKPLDADRYSPRTFRPVGLASIDHIVGNVEEGKMNEWVRFYEKVLGFSQLISFDDKDISTEYSALMSKVVQNGTGRIKFPINEPAQGKRRSQIEEYLNYYHGPGVQHIALTCKDIVETVRALRHNDVSFSARTTVVLRRSARARRSHRGEHGRPGRIGHPRRSRRRGVHAPDLHQTGGRPADAVFRDHRAARLEELRQGQLQGAVRGDRTRAGPPRHAIATSYPQISQITQLGEICEICGCSIRRLGLSLRQLGRREGRE